MRVLQLCPKPPFPASDGGTLAMHSVTEGLLKTGQEVRVLSIETEKHPFRKDELPPSYLGATKAEAVFVDTRVKLFPAFTALFSASAYVANRFYSEAFSMKLEKVLQEETFDIIQLESLYMAPYLDVIRRHSKAKIVLRAHNVESALWKRRTASEKNVLKRTWFRNLTKKLARYEAEVLRAVDALVPITPEDAAAFSRMLKGASHPVHVLPFAMRPPTIQPGVVRPDTVFHIGAMDWAPNEEGVAWLVKEVWPRVLAKRPGATLHLAGKQLEKNDTRFSGKNITVHGEVGDAFEFMGSYAVMAVPLLGGGGMRVKLVEGMALGKPIVTTTIGAEGTGVKSDRHLLVTDTPGAFAEALCLLLEEPGRAAVLGENAKAFVASNFSLAAASEKLNDFYASLLT